MDLQNKIVVVIGAAKSGQSAARLLHQLKARVKISEAGTELILDDQFRLWIQANRIECQFEGHTQDFIEQSDLVVLSPGVRIDALPVQWARAKGVPIWSEIELASRFCQKPIIAITGSNGKTTVSTLIKMMLDACGKRACLCGNVGNPFTEFVLKNDAYDYFVTEISSFQLETIETFKPHIALFLNFSQNHLDRHKNIEEYFAAKTRIFLNQDQGDFAVLNAKDEWVKRLATQLKAHVSFFNDDEPYVAEINNPNHLAVLAVAHILRLPMNICRREIDAFKGVEHRMEKIRNLNGVEYINDSKATTVEAGRWALESISRPIVMLCGGRDKNLDFSVIRSLVAKKVKTMIVFGEARAKLREAFDGVVPLLECTTLEDAVNGARQVAQPGDVAMLVPMCTSYDMFKNFEERGHAFKTIVQNLK
ncbi:MAG: UDP-N-acetylmuramoyl-L-alanine--D-glutamate ligase [Candidatus Omnitrophica bacterium]|nr:UDP-N-acetylmuramoyl-L-alanine--D-glutamate ligase [Candidatus Omnitrophota bacterium]